MFSKNKLSTVCKFSFFIYFILYNQVIIKMNLEKSFLKREMMSWIRNDFAKKQMLKK